MIFLLLLASVGNRITSDRVETVDLIELNHCSWGDGYTKWILYEWSPEYCRFHVVDYTAGTKGVPLGKMGPMHRIQMRGRVIQSECYIETWTNFDRELANDKLWPTWYRRAYKHGE